jgi:hypothetical protein
MILVDTNVHLDVLSDDPNWAEWSSRQLAKARAGGPIVINAVIYAELASGYATQEELDDYVTAVAFDRQALPWEAAFLAGRAFMAYRRRGGNKTAPLPDFFIGAHAQVAGLPLLTRDATRYRSYFPKVKLIAP